MAPCTLATPNTITIWPPVLCVGVHTSAVCVRCTNAIMDVPTGVIQSSITVTARRFLEFWLSACGTVHLRTVACFLWQFWRLLCSDLLQVWSFLSCESGHACCPEHFMWISKNGGWVQPKRSVHIHMNYDHNLRGIYTRTHLTWKCWPLVVDSMPLVSLLVFLTSVCSAHKFSVCHFLALSAMSSGWCKCLSGEVCTFRKTLVPMCRCQIFWFTLAHEQQKGTPSEDASWSENVEACQYFHLQASCGGSVNIYATEVPFPSNLSSSGCCSH